MWTTTGNMIEAPVANTATLLSDGSVLVAGGITIRSGERFPASAQLYDPSSRSWSATGNMIEFSRSDYTATLLRDGKVLVAGGYPSPLASAELYDPSTGSWTATGRLVTARDLHTATLLPDGKVLVTGGIDSTVSVGHAVAAAELYDPASGTWIPTGNMVQARVYDTATLLLDGRVLVAGGSSSGTLGEALASAELYDPASGTWTASGNMNAGRSGHTATLLPDGTVLVVGGSNGSGLLAPAELYDPSSGSWTATGAMVEPRYGHTATLLANSKVLVVGGSAGQDALASAELYDPLSGSWTAIGSMTAGRSGHTATLLADGTVLVAGGSTRVAAELYNPGSGT
ncbi:MAG: kelch repeat-containing protein [Chloroflexota bacterium]